MKNEATRRMANAAADLNDSNLDAAIAWCETDTKGANGSEYHQILVAEKARRAEWRAARAAEQAKQDASWAPLRAAGWKLAR